MTEKQHEEFDEILERELEVVIQDYKEGRLDSSELCSKLIKQIERMAVSVGAHTDKERLDFVFKTLNTIEILDRINKVASIYGTGSTLTPPITRGDFRAAMDIAMELPEAPQQQQSK